MTGGGDLANLYRDVVLDHSRAPRHFGRIPDADASATGSNPLCGDHLTVYLRASGGRISEVGFDGSGCAISVASASMMTELLADRTIDEARGQIAALRQLLEDSQEDTAQALPSDSPLLALSAVRRYPSRIKCATLAWVAAAGALNGQRTATTE